MLLALLGNANGRKGSQPWDWFPSLKELSEGRGVDPNTPEGMAAAKSMARAAAKRAAGKRAVAKSAAAKAKRPAKPAKGRKRK